MADGIGGYVLVSFQNAVYIEIEKGDHFGIVDMLSTKEDYQRFTTNVDLDSS